MLWKPPEVAGGVTSGRFITSSNNLTFCLILVQRRLANARIKVDNFRPASGMIEGLKGLGS